MTEEGVHPGSWVGDSVEEFKKLPTWGKALAVGTLVLVAYLGYRAYVGGKSTAGAPLNMQGNLQPTNNQQGGSSPFPQVSSGDQSVPLLPSGVNPLFNTSGGLVGYQQSAPSSPPPPSQTGETPNKPSLFTVLTRGLWTGEKADSGGVPIWTSPNADWKAMSGSVPKNSQIQVGQSITGNYFGKQATYYPVTYNGQTGYIGEWDLNQKSPPVASHAPPASTPSGGGGMSWQSRVYRLTHYTPQVGDNMNEVANKLGYGDWQNLKQEGFTHGERFELP